MITRVALENGKEIEVRQDAHFLQRSRKIMLVNFDSNEIIDTLTKEELKTMYLIFNSFDSTMNKANILKVSFSSITKNLKTVSRSRFKKKLIDLGIIANFRNKLWINPFILEPRNDKNISDYKHWVQQSWKYLFIDKDHKDRKYLDGFIDEIFE